MTKPLRILLLEDSPADAELNEHVLRKAGIAFQSRRVEHRDEFLNALEEFAPDLVLADFRLPDIDGMQALDFVRERSPNLPFIFVTGALGEEAAVETLHRGADDYLLKDRLGRLPEAVNRSLKAAEQRRVMQDIRKALEASEASFRALVETSSDWIWEMDAEGTYRYCSPSVYTHLGYEPEQVTGRRLFEFMSESEAIRVKSLFKALETEYQPFLMVEWICKHRDGKAVFLETSGLPIRDADGRLIGFHGTTRDVSERKQLAEELRLMRQREQAISESEAIDKIAQDSTAGAESGRLRLREQRMELFNNIVSQFGIALDMALEQRVKRITYPVPDELRRLANALGSVFAGPRDVIDIYVTVMQSRSQNAPSQKVQAYAEESRLLALELMGNLVAYYQGKLLTSSVSLSSPHQLN